MDLVMYQSKIHQIIERLTALGYRFAYPQEVMPGPVALSKIETFERLVGPLPALLRDFYATVGSVNFIGEHPSWQRDLYTDPFYISDFDYLLSRAEDYASDPETKAWFDECYGAFAIELSPDYYHKADVSGGECYHIVLPADADPVIHGMPTVMRFSEYLDNVLKWGGFPGLADYDHDWPVDEIVG